MIGLDTNLLVRLLVGDDPSQLAIAADVVSREDTFVPVTVLLETEWVLRAAYDIPREVLHAALVGVCELERLTVEDEPAVRRALDAYRQGLDLADALHLSRCGACSRFLTFDKRIVRRAAGLSGRPVVEVPEGR